MLSTRTGTSIRRGYSTRTVTSCHRRSRVGPLGSNANPHESYLAHWRQMQVPDSVAPAHVRLGEHPVLQASLLLNKSKRWAPESSYRKVPVPQVP